MDTVHNYQYPNIIRVMVLINFVLRSILSQIKHAHCTHYAEYGVLLYRYNTYKLYTLI